MLSTRFAGQVPRSLLTGVQGGSVAYSLGAMSLDGMGGSLAGSLGGMAGSLGGSLGGMGAWDR